MKAVQLVTLRNLLTVIFGGLDTNNLELVYQAARRMATELEAVKPDDYGMAQRGAA